jgi:hypothetical protein
MGVRLPASTALIDNEVLLEATVAHEFLHCFYTLREVIAGLQRGVHELNDSFDYYSREEDDQRLAPVADWFHTEIDIPHHDDLRLLRTEEYFLELSKELPARPTPFSYHIHRIDIPDDIAQHARLLLKSEIDSPNDAAPTSAAP